MTKTNPIIVILVAMWLVLIVDTIIPADLVRLGLVPRSITGLIGIPLMPLLHGGFAHLIRNTFPLAILLVLATQSRRQAWPAIGAIWLGSGLLLWLVGRSAVHVGASGLVFGLITFLIVVGIRERKLKSIGIAVLVGVLFGGTLLWGIIPSFSGDVSWDGHLCGAIVGGIVGAITSQNRKGFF